MHSDFKNKVIFTLVVLFLAAAFLIITLPPKRINLNSPDVAPHVSPKEQAHSESNSVNRPETVNDHKEKIDYYVIVGTFRNLTLAQEKAAKLKNDFNTDIIILPPTAEGYYRISYGKYSTPEEAKSIIKNIGKNISSDAWVFSVKK